MYDKYLYVDTRRAGSNICWMSFATTMTHTWHTTYTHGGLI